MTEMRKAYADCCYPIKYTEISIDELANKYCEAYDANDKSTADKYFSALILRFWYQVDRIYNKVKHISGIDRDDCAIRLAECIKTACDYRAWQTDPSLNAQQCIQQTIGSRGAAAILYEYNTTKRVVHTKTVSMYTPIAGGDGDDTETTITDTLEDEADNISEAEGTKNAVSFIQYYVNNDKLIEAIILDNIAFNDTTREYKKSITYTEEDDTTGKRVISYQKFDAGKCLSYLKDISGDYAAEFSAKYKVSLPALDVAINTITKASPNKLKKYLKATLTDAKSNVKLLCN